MWSSCCELAFLKTEISFHLATSFLFYFILILERGRAGKRDRGRENILSRQVLHWPWDHDLSPSQELEAQPTESPSAPPSCHFLMMVYLSGLCFLVSQCCNEHTEAIIFLEVPASGTFKGREDWAPVDEEDLSWIQLFVADSWKLESADSGNGKFVPGGAWAPETLASWIRDRGSAVSGLEIPVLIRNPETWSGTQGLGAGDSSKPGSRCS